MKDLVPMKDLFPKLFKKEHFNTAPLLTLIGQANLENTKDVVADYVKNKNDSTAKEPEEEFTIIQTVFMGTEEELPIKTKNKLKEVARELNYQCFNNKFVKIKYWRETTSDTRIDISGILAYIKTTKLDAKNTDLEKGMLYNLLDSVNNNLSKKLTENTPVLFMHPVQIQKLRRLYKLETVNIGLSETEACFCPETKNNSTMVIGEIELETIETPFGLIPFVCADVMPTDKILLTSLKRIKPVIFPVPNYGSLFVNEIASENKEVKKYQMYGHINIDWNNENAHGVIVNLKK